MRECSYDLTDFGGAWPIVAAAMKLRYVGRGTDPNTNKGAFIWEDDNHFITVETYNNPETGEYRNAGERRPQLGYASYIGVSGEDDAVATFIYLTRLHAVYIKDRSESRTYA